MSGQLSGQVPNQLGMAQRQNGNALQPAQMHNLVGGVTAGVGPPNNQVKSNEVVRMRQAMVNTIFRMIHQGKPETSDDAKSKLMLLARRFEDRLARMAPSKEAYMDLQTLEARIRSLIKTNQRQANASPSAGTLMPGMSHGGNKNAVSMCTVDTPTITSSRMHGGSLSNGYQQSSVSFSNGSGATIPLMGAQRPPGQMVPTPGYHNKNANFFQSHMHLENSNNGVGNSSVESVMATPSQHDRKHTGGSNGLVLDNRGSLMNDGLRPGLQQKCLGMNSDSVQLPNDPCFSKPFQQSFDLLQQPVVHGLTSNKSDSFGSGDLYGSIMSAWPLPNSRNINSASLISVPRANSSASDQSNFQGMQPPLQVKSELVGHVENTSSQSLLPARGNLPQAHQQQTYHLQDQLRFPQMQYQQNQNQQQRHLLNENASGESQLGYDVATVRKPEHGVQHHNGVLLSRDSEQLQPSALQNQFHQNTAESRFRFAKEAFDSSSHHDICPSVPPQDQQLQQMLHQHHSPLRPHNNSSSLSFGPQPDSVQRLQPTQSRYETKVTGQNQKALGQVAQDNDLSIEGCAVGQSLAPRSILGVTSPSYPSSAPHGYKKENHDPHYRNQQKWLLYLWHVRSLTANGGKSEDPNVITTQMLLRHMNDCGAPNCVYPRCRQTKGLVGHYKQCKSLVCPVCVFVKRFVQRHVKRKSHFATLKTGSSRLVESAHVSDREISEAASDDVSKLQPSPKRLKIEHLSKSFVAENEASAMSASATSEAQSLEDVRQNDNQQSDVCTTLKSDVAEISVKVCDASDQGNPCIRELKKDVAEHRPGDGSVTLKETVCLPNKEMIKFQKPVNISKEENATQSMEIEVGSKSSKSKIKGVSLMEMFMPADVREHICGLRQWVGQSKAKAEKNQAMERSMTKDACQLCAVERLAFEPTPMYCIPCGARIKRNAMYYTMGAGENRHFLCIPCYNESRGDSVVIEGTSILKAKFEKKKNDEEIEEWWVQCDKCEAWQHQICALFNGRMNDGQAEYTCPNCYLQEVERGERKPLPQSAVLGAKDLPKTILSNHLEQRLSKKLRQERQERARVQGKNYDEVPGAEALVVRVVSSIDKKLEVKPYFLDVFREERYPAEFPYKSKAVLLFQKIEGVEVCLFAMYVQEFGSECASPNQRRVYLSYLDSVKYFRPEVKTVSGEALRTFVYHEILIGYLEYCKKRGFTSCYIWACPPLKGEDYILYCHPEIQKTPKSDKLREWYLSMIRKATKEKVVVESTNLHDHFFLQTGERRAKATAARLPYFDGDYWPGAAEDIIYQINQEEDGKHVNKKGVTKKTISKRALKASGYSDLSANASKDLLLMHKLGSTISPMKEDFIMVHLQHCCTHCCVLMVSGNRWVCHQCKNFQICDNCYNMEQNRGERERHPVNHKDMHTLYPVEITDIPSDTKDTDDILESEFFDTRQSFLTLCQGNHYQYDTLRRAKHSSMMVLYHLHNPTAPAFAATCSVCHLDIETGQAWHCDVCQDFDVCKACYSKGINHPHKLSNNPSSTDEKQNVRQQRVSQMHKMLDLLVHATSCRMQCQYPNCRKLKSLFRHGNICTQRISGGCSLCKKIWSLLQHHARSCKDSNCSIPRCRDLNNHWRRLQQQSESRRRAAVAEMMRERAAEVETTCG